MFTKVPCLTSFNKNLRIEGSKSYANRALILGALNRQEVVIKNIPKARDVQEMIGCLRVIGLDIEEKRDEVIIKNSFPQCEDGKPKILQSGEGGTTNRFLLAFLALGKSEYTMIPSGLLMKRPFNDYESLFRNLCVRFEIKEDRFVVQGPAIENKISIDCLKTTQTASSFLLSGFNIQTTNLDSSKSYYELTQNLIKQENQMEFYINPDMSSASYSMAMGALLGEVTIGNINNDDDYQADSIFINLLSEIGIETSLSEKGLIISRRTVQRGFNFDGSKAIDLIPTLVFVASHIPFESKFSNLENLVYKESNRLEEILKTLKTFHVEYVYKDNILSIRGRESYNKQDQIECADDHRIVMMNAMFLAKNGGGNISHPSSVEKSYPQFFVDLF